MSLSYLGSAFNNSNNSNYILTSGSNQWGSVVLNMVPPDNSLARCLIYMSSNSATNYSSNLSFSQGDSNNRLSVDISSSNCSLKFNGSALVACNLQPIYNSNVELAVRTRLDNTKVYYNRSLLINYVGSNLDFSTGWFTWGSSNGANASSTTYISYPSLEGVFTVSNSLEVLSSSKFQNINAANITATSITTPALTSMSNLLYGVSNSTFISSVSANTVTTPTIYFDSNQQPSITATGDSLTALIGSTSADTFSVKKNGDIPLLTIQSGLTNSAVFNSSLDATSITENGASLSSKYAYSNALSNTASNLFSLSNWTSNSIYTLSNSLSNYTTSNTLSNVLGTYSNYVDVTFRKNSASVPWSAITGAPDFDDGSSGGGIGSFFLNGLISGGVSVATSMAANGISVNGQSIMEWGTSGFEYLQSAVTDFAVDGLSSKIMGIKELLSPKGGGSPFMTYEPSTEKVSLLCDYMRSGNASVHIDGCNNRICITQSNNGYSNVYIGQDKTYFSSNVGIGVTSPSFKLDVSGTSHFSSNLYTDKIVSFSNNSLFSTPSVGTNGGNGDRLVLWSGTDSTYPFSIGIGNGSMWSSVPPSIQHMWFIGGTQTMCLSNQNLGVGVTNPAYRVDVLGDLRVTNGGNSAGAGGAINFQANSAAAPMAQIKGSLANSGLGGLQDQGGMAFFTREYSACNTSNVPLAQKMILDNIGNLGIGTLTPAYKLDIGNGTEANAALRLNTVDGDKIILTNAGSNGSKITHAANWTVNLLAGQSNANSGNITFQTGTTSGYTTRLLVNSTGNVGIGSATPTQKLDVVGNIVSSGMVMSSTMSAVTSLTTPLVQNTGGDLNLKAEYEIKYTADYDGNNGGAAHIFNSSTNERMRITSVGNVGIGTNNPAQKLDVVGSVKVSGAVQAGSVNTTGAVQAGSVTSTGDVSAASLTTTGTAQAAKISCGYISVTDYSVNAASYASDVFSY